MNPVLRNPIVRVSFLVLASAAVPAAAGAQLISLKTAPIASGEQFLLLPSRTLGMGSLSIGIRDDVADPFSNPAKGVRLEHAHLFAAPTFYDVSDDRGAGTTLAVGALGRSGRWFGGGAFAAQQLQDPNRGSFFAGDDDGSLFGEARANRYLQGFAGIAFPDARLSIGAAVRHASLSVTDGIRQLYATSARVAQNGDVTDVRIGALRELEGGGWLEATVVHNRVDITHDVLYVDFVRDELGVPWQQRQRLERNIDRTRTTGVHFGAVHPLAAPGWTIGGSVTLNRKLHPKIPNYDLVSIPRDPGNSTVADLGIGFTHTDERSIFGVQLHYQPGRSHTWADTPTPVTAADGTVIPAGGKTIENWFTYGNMALGSGITRDAGAVSWQLGLDLLFYDYELEQENYLQASRRDGREGWVEWSPSWGLIFEVGAAEIRYAGRIRAKGFPSLFTTTVDEVFAPPDVGGPDLLIAPTQPVRLPDYHTFTNQISFVLPIGGR